MIRVSNLDGAPRDRPRGRMEQSEKQLRRDRGPSGSSVNYRTYATFVRVNHLTMPWDVRCFLPLSSRLVFSFASPPSSSSSLTLRWFRPLPSLAFPYFRFFPTLPPFSASFFFSNWFYFFHVLTPFRQQAIRRILRPFRSLSGPSLRPRTENTTSPAKAFLSRSFIYTRV